MLEAWIVGEGIGRYPNAIAQEEGILALRTKRQGKVSEQAHITLAPRMRSRHGISICYQPVIVRLSIKIATQHLKRVGAAFDFLLQDRPIGFKRAAGIFEMRFVASVGEKREEEQKTKAEENQCDSTWPSQRPGLFIAGENRQSSISYWG